MRRGAFLALAALPIAAVRRVGAQSEFDPAISSQQPALRVLLDGEPGAGAYRGRIERLDDGRFVNIVGIEEYLYGVVPREMSPRWPAAALQAQTIASRTYVLQRSDPRRAYDLVPSELDQVYRGIAGESPATSAAVDATAGRVLTFGGLYAEIAYSSCCGGHTEASNEAWGSKPIPYLGGVVCTSCGDSPNFRWTSPLPLDAIATHFAQQLAPFGELQNLRITARDASGRARGFELLAREGSCVVKAGTFRLAIGPRALRSLLVTSLDPPLAGSITAQGGGLGHGVGLCQWGARGMALGGQPAESILRAYFPGTTIAHLDR